ncbi:MAG: glycoside hydrolase family 3 N-terminal domain-containing protein [Candidatus Izemoplasmatales bacterium]|nr:glycoside hydrolase family 3 N-terminal domain-containing protein [Candidatus Izemoplasmatales bacterium]
MKLIWKNRPTRIWMLISTILAFLMVLTIIAVQIPFLNQTMSTLFGGERRVITSPSGESYVYYESDYLSKELTLQKANELNETIVGEGAILLKNDNNALPISGSKSISVFGKNSINLVYGGSGSGEKSGLLEADLYSSLVDAGFTINPTLKSFYENNSKSGDGRASNPSMGALLTGFATGETPISSYTQDVKNSYSEYNNAAIVVFSRIGGEGYDLPHTMQVSLNDPTPVDGASSASDHYLQLDTNEKVLLEEAKANFSKVIVIINCATTMELGDLQNDTGIDSILWIGTTGGTGINAVGKILNGEINPSGRTVDTYVRNFKNDPTWQNFSFNGIRNGNRYVVDDVNRPFYYVDYEEGIYVGYRYYETRGYEEVQNNLSSTWYEDNVVYPFGFGLSYSSFEWDIISSSYDDGDTLDKDGKIEVTVRVKNIGSVKGKDVVQLYFTAPYTEGGIEKSYLVLGAFVKTDLLNPNQRQDVKLSFDVMDMVSYDYNDANNNGFIGYELEGGEYQIQIMKNSHELVNSYTYSVPNSGFIINSSTEYGVQPENRFDNVSAKINSTNTDITGGTMTVMSRANFAGTMPTTPTVLDRSVSGTFIEGLAYSSTPWTEDANKPYYVTTAPTQASSILEDKDVNLTLYDMIGVDYDDPSWDTFLNQLTVSQMSTLIGSGNFHTEPLVNLSVPRTTDPDGPVGFTNFMEIGEATVYDTCFYASPTVVAATWNIELAYEQGKMIGNEGIWGNERGDQTPYSGWYAPAVNIHRTPFSGRNWEYYSEDGFLSGKMAAGVISGAKEKGVYTFVKHFAFNDQETNRDSNGLLTWMDEQTMREIYLKPFELAVKEGETTAIMSSFNRIGTVWTGGSYELLTEILRDEWGFKGMVITDYNVYAHMPADQMIRAGGDLNLIQDKRPTTSEEALTSTQISLMRQASKNILYTVANSNAMSGLGEGAVIRYLMPRWTVAMIIIESSITGLIIVSGVFVIYRMHKKKLLM